MEGIQLLRSGGSQPSYMAPSSSSIEDPTQDDPMQALVTRLQQIQTAPSVQIWEQQVPGNWAINYLLLELDTLIRFLRDKRAQAEHAVETSHDDAPTSYDDEKRHKMRLYARKEWRDIQKKAVRLNVADLIVSFLPPLDAATKAKMLLSIRTLDDLVVLKRQANQSAASSAGSDTAPADLPDHPRPSVANDDTALTVPPMQLRLSTSKSGATAVPSSPASTSFSTPLPLQQTQMEDKLLELVYEFIAGGFVAAQDALYDAIVEQEDRFVVFVMRHLKRHDESPFVLLVLQQLCENHHCQWQALMRANDASSFLHVIARQLMDVYWKEVPMSDHDATMCSLILGLFTEACQGPCDENQRVLVASPALHLCVDLVLGLVRYEDSVPARQRVGVQQAAANVLLAMMEGRTDMYVQNAIAKLLTAPRVLHRIIAHHKALVFSTGFDLGSGRGFGLKSSAPSAAASPSSDHADAAFTEVINLLQIAFRMTNSNLSTSNMDTPGSTSISSGGLDALYPHVVTFMVEWDELKTKLKAHDVVEFFQREMVSVEVSRLGASFTVYFLKPKSAKYFDKTLKRRFLNSMDMGTDDALQVLISEPAQNIQEELNVMGRLEKLKLYSWLSEWNWQLRIAHLYLCAYINFVLIMTLKYPATATTAPATSAAVVDVVAKTEALKQLLNVLGVGLFAASFTLFAFHFMQTLSFSYSKQQITLVKLKLASPGTIRRNVLSAFTGFLYYLQLFGSTFAIVIFLYSTDDSTTQTLGACAAVVLTVSFLSALRKAAGMLRFVVSDTATYRDMVQTQHGVLHTRFCFWYSVLYDTLFAGPVMLFGFYTLCAFLALQPFEWASLFYGFPLMDILETNKRLNFIALAMRTNLGKLGVTAVFGAISIYIFSLVGFFLLQKEMQPDDADASHCASLLQCFATYVRYGLLSGGGIGDYISSSLNHELEFDQPQRYFERMVYDMAFYVVVITLFLNMVQGIIIDAFTSVREEAETKAALKRERCLVCNRARSAIELAGMEKGHLNNFARHTQDEHNLLHYFFFIQQLNAKDESDRNGIESYVFEKLKTKDMSWIPRV